MSGPVLYSTGTMPRSPYANAEWAMVVDAKPRLGLSCVSDRLLSPGVCSNFRHGQDKTGSTLQLLFSSPEGGNRSAEALLLGS